MMNSNISDNSKSKNKDSDDWYLKRTIKKISSIYKNRSINPHKGDIIKKFN